MPGRVVIPGNGLPPGSLDIVEWAEASSDLDSTNLRVGHFARPVSMHGADGATGEALVSNGAIGADVIRVAAGKGFAPHTHPGHHLLIVIAGKGTITYDGVVYPTRAGQIYLVEGLVPHAVGAITDHVILAAGSPHKAVDAVDRMALVDYEEVVSEIGDLHCLICDIVAPAPTRLHDVQCPHCPCPECVGAETHHSAATGAGQVNRGSS
jgi:quercetin dioxygenase-like cupin family protein